MSQDDKEIHFKEVWLIDKLQLSKDKKVIILFLVARYIKEL